MLSWAQCEGGGIERGVLSGFDCILIDTLHIWRPSASAVCQNAMPCHGDKVHTQYDYILRTVQNKYGKT
jgi:hypothetical protein